MDKKIITRLEELVEQISECYTSIPKNVLVELNELTGSGWTEEKYIEYCAGYWSNSTLEETVYALLHDGEFPVNVETNIYFWKATEQLELPDVQVMQKLREITENIDEGFVNQYEDLPIIEIFNWLRSYYSDWNVNKELNDEEIKTNSFKVTFANDKIGEEEYGKCKYTMLKVYNSKVFALLCCNLYENEKQDILEFASKLNLYAFEC